MLCTLLVMIKKDFFSLFTVGSITYVIFLFLHTTEFSYAKDKAAFLLENKIGDYKVNDLFFKYNDTFVYINNLDPIEKKIEDITIFQVEGYKVHYTINAPYATFDGEKWTAYDATLKTHIYQGDELQRYTVEHKERIETLEGYKPKIIESLYEGKALNIIDAYTTWRLLMKQNLSSNKIRSSLYDKIVVPLFSIAMLLILFFKLPFHARMMNMGGVIALSLAATFITWGILFGLSQMGANGIVIPELTAIFPIILLWAYAIYVYFTDERSLA